MKIRKGFVLRSVAGEKVVSAEGPDQLDFNRLVVLNSSAAYLWEQVEGRQFDADMLASLLESRYGISAARAASDAAALIEEWRSCGLVED